MSEGRKEFYRKFVHLAFGVCLALTIYMLDKSILLTLFSLGIAIYFLIVKFFSKLPAFLQKTILYLSREDELKFMIGKGSFFFILAILICLILFSKTAVATATLIAAVGDAFSTIIGKNYGRHKLPYNKNKSFEGSLAFFTSSTGAILFFDLLINVNFKIFCLIFVALICTILESFIKRSEIIDDNLIIIVVGAFLLSL